MSPEPKTSVLLAGNRESAPAKGGDPLGSGLRAILLLSFGGLLALLLYSGANALHTLRELHETEESTRARSVERRRVLSTVVLSASTYNDNMEAILLRVKPEGTETDDDLAKRGEQTRAALQAYPSDRTAEEQALIEQLQKYLVEEDRAFRSASGWGPDGREKRAQEMVSQEIIPRRQEFIAIAQKIELLNDQQTIAARQASFAEFSRLQDRLTRFLILALTSGLLLAGGSALYILRLERQVSFRYAELVDSRGELQQLSARLVDAQESERRSISRELHDEVGQSLGLLLMDAGRLSNHIGSTDKKSQELVGNIKGVAERAVQTVRNMALLLRPSMLDDLGLVPAVEWYERELSRQGAIEVKVHAENVSEHLPDEVKVCLYRVIQEASNNAQRHSNARDVLVELIQSNDAIYLKITDDGS